MWPWDWVIAAGSGLSGLTQKAVNWVSSLVASAMSWVASSITTVWVTIASILRDISHVWNSFLSWAGQITFTVLGAIDRFVHILSNWILGLVGQLWAYVKSLYSWALTQVNALWSFVGKMAGDIYGWVLREVYYPLIQLYNGIRSWVMQEFGLVWQYIQHPELLVSLLAGYILRNALKYAKQYAIPVTRWIITQMRGLAGEVFDLLEHVISSVL